MKKALIYLFLCTIITCNSMEESPAELIEQLRIAVKAKPEEVSLTGLKSNNNVLKIIDKMDYLDLAASLVHAQGLKAYNLDKIKQLDLQSSEDSSTIQKREELVNELPILDKLILILKRELKLKEDEYLFKE